METLHLSETAQGINTETKRDLGANSYRRISQRPSLGSPRNDSPPVSFGGGLVHRGNPLCSRKGTMPIATSGLVPKLPLKISACSLAIFYTQRLGGRPWAASEVQQANPQQTRLPRAAPASAAGLGCAHHMQSPTER